jgi:hypothetical protein
MKKNPKNFFSLDRIRKIPWEILIALTVNILLVGLFFVFKPDSPKPAPMPAEIAVDISDFTPPKPKEMPVPQSVKRASKLSESVVAPIDNATLTKRSMTEFTPTPVPVGVSDAVSMNKRKADLERIIEGMKTFDGINNIKSGIAKGSMPAGMRIGESFSLRKNIKQRERLLRRYGGSEKTQQAVNKSLDYLQSVQNSNGSWGSAESFKSGDAIALTSLALLTYFAHGEDFNSKKYSNVIKKGTDYLVKLANTDNIELAGEGFGHAILTYTLAEGYAMTGSFSLKDALEKRLVSIISKQNKFGSFAPKYDNSPYVAPDNKILDEEKTKELTVGEPVCDLSLLGWHVQALASAKSAGIEVENMDKVLNLALEALVKIHQAKQGGFSQGINMKRFEADDSMNPVGLLSMYLLNSRTSSPARRASKLIENVKTPNWNSRIQFPLYRYYYQTQALFQTERGRGKKWEAWNESLKKTLLAVQRSDGSWGVPSSENTFRVRNKQDLNIYSTSLCSLMLQVYYRYLPSYSIAENNEKSQKADALDLGAQGLIAKLPGGADPMADVILGTGTNKMEPIFFGQFNSIPQTAASVHAKEEFDTYASFASTIQVRTPRQWPQTLQPKQRIALFLDELLPRNFKGHLSIKVAVISKNEDVFDYKNYFEFIINGKRLYYSYLYRKKQLVDVIVPSSYLLPYNNILQVRNNGDGVLAFDAASLESVNKVGRKLYLLAKNKKRLPARTAALFTSIKPKTPEFLELSAHSINRELFSETQGTYNPEKEYIGVISALGNERMGNKRQVEYARQFPREIVDWISGGGSGLMLKNIMDGGKFYDSVFKTPYPALEALKQAAKLFYGHPRYLPAQIFPKFGNKALFYSNAVAAYNSPGVATILIGKRFRMSQETQILALVPWSGKSIMEIENGICTEDSPFNGLLPKITRQRKEIQIDDNIFSYSGVFPELTVIRIYKEGFEPQQRPLYYQSEDYPIVKFDVNSVKNLLPKTDTTFKHYLLRTAKNLVSIYGEKVSYRIIPATTEKDEYEKFKPLKPSSINLTFTLNGVKNKLRHDSVYLSLGSGPEKPQCISFDVFTRYSSLKKRPNIHSLPMRFAFAGKCYQTDVSANHWRRIQLPLKDINPYWKTLRILFPGRITNRDIHSISYEINNITVMYKK